MIFSRINMCSLYFLLTKKVKNYYFKKNNIGMNGENKIDNKFNIENKKIRK